MYPTVVRGVRKIDASITSVSDHKMQERGRVVCPVWLQYFMLSSASVEPLSAGSREVELEVGFGVGSSTFKELVRSLPALCPGHESYVYVCPLRAQIGY